MLWKQHYFCVTYKGTVGGHLFLLLEILSRGQLSLTLRAADNQVVLQSQISFKSCFVFIVFVVQQQEVNCGQI